MTQAKKTQDKKTKHSNTRQNKTNTTQGKARKQQLPRFVLVSSKSGLFVNQSNISISKKLPD
jgi:hypothetical protein